jgi:hypothetical protein
MTILNNIRIEPRKLTVFDPSNEKHRSTVAYFVKNARWAPDAPRWAPDAKYISTAHQVQAKLLDWYIANEEIESV